MKAISAIILSVLLSAWCPADELELRGGQNVELRITGVPSKDQAEFNGTYSISENGGIRLQFIGEVSSAGMKPSELAARIERAYKDAKIYVNPTINVMPKRDVDLPFVTVLGEVRTPGMMEFQSGVRVMAAIANSGGSTDFADERRVQLTRDGKSQELDLRKANSTDDVELKPGDKITVVRARLRLF